MGTPSVGLFKATWLILLHSRGCEPFFCLPASVLVPSEWLSTLRGVRVIFIKHEAGRAAPSQPCFSLWGSSSTGSVHEPAAQPGPWRSARERRTQRIRNPQMDRAAGSVPGNRLVDGHNLPLSQEDEASEVQTWKPGERAGEGRGREEAGRGQKGRVS